VREATPEPRLVNIDIPDGLNRVIVKALEKNRDLRYQTASDLRADLRRLMRDLESHTPAIAPPPPKAESAVGN
jgi:hypothetical protein